MADAILGIWTTQSASSVYWFGLSIDDGTTSVPLPLGGSVTVEVQTGPATWQALTYTVTRSPWGVDAIRATVPGAYRDGTEHVIRAIVDGVTYGPWSVRMYP